MVTPSPLATSPPATARRRARAARLQRWRVLHTWAGLMLLLPLLVLVCTGLALNHADDLRLPHARLPAWLAESMYDVPIPARVDGVLLDEDWFTQINGQLYQNRTPVGVCDGRWHGLVKLATYAVAGCGDTLVLLDTRQAVVLERLQPVHGVPAFSALAVEQGQLYLRSETQTWQADLDALVFSPVPQPVATATALKTRPLPERLQGWARSQFVPDSLHWERWLQDVHASRWLGRAGVWLMDIIGVLLLVLALSGALTWYQKGRIRKP